MKWKKNSELDKKLNKSGLLLYNIKIGQNHEFDKKWKPFWIWFLSLSVYNSISIFTFSLTFSKDDGETTE